MAEGAAGQTIGFFVYFQSFYAGLVFLNKNGGYAKQ
jgi:hypothetical protein